MTLLMPMLNMIWFASRTVMLYPAVKTPLDFDTSMRSPPVSLDCLNHKLIPPPSAKISLSESSVLSTNSQPLTKLKQLPRTQSLVCRVTPILLLGCIITSLPSPRLFGEHQRGPE